MEYRQPPRSANRAGQGKPAPQRSSAAADRPARTAARSGAPARNVRGAHPSAPTERIKDRASAPAPPRRRPPPRKAAPPPQKPKPRMIGGKVFLSILSILVLVGTGYYWKVADDFKNGLSTADLISGSGERPADGAVDILMVGMDSRTDAQGNTLSKEQLAMLNAGRDEGVTNTDTLIMIRIPNDGGKAYGMSIPRDAYVEIPGYGKHKINSAYARAKNSTAEELVKKGISGRELELKSNQEGSKNLIATVEKLTGAKVDHYAEVNLLGFYDITNAIGGVEVCLNKATKDSFSGANFPAGVQTLQGVQALQFVRQRHGLTNGDIDRITRQQTFMSAMAKKVLSKDMLVPGSSTLGKLQEAIKKAVLLDQGWDVLKFAQQMVTFTGGNLNFQTIPIGTTALETPNDGVAIQVDPTAVRKFVQSALTGGAPPEDKPTSAGPSSSAKPTGKATVTVLNGSGRTGLGAEVADTLTNAGFTTGEPGNAPARTKTVVRYPKGDKTTGQAVADALDGEDFAVEEDANLGKGKITVIIGKDFPQAGQRLAAAPMVALNGLAQEPKPACIN